MSDTPGWSEDDEALAAEYALGVLDTAAHEAARRRLATDAAFRAAVAAWQERLVPLADDIAPVPPPARVRAAVETRLFGAPRRSGLFRRFAGLAAGAAAAAVVVAVVLATVDLSRPPALVAEIAAEDRGVVIAARLEGDVLAIDRRAGLPPPGRVFELWLIGADGVPVSLGVLPDAGGARLALPAALRERLAPGLVLAISDEPPGGSPTGAPTGTVRATGPITSA